MENENSMQVNAATTDTSGNVGITMIWPAPLRVGQYDIIMDLNRDGILDSNEPVDDLAMDGGIQAVPEFTTIFLPIIIVLGIAFIFQRRDGNV